MSEAFKRSEEVPLAVLNAVVLRLREAGVMLAVVWAREEVSV